MPEKGAGVSLKDFSRGSVVEGQEGKEDGAGPESISRIYCLVIDF